MKGNILGTTAFITNELADYNAANDYFATPISGNCLDSDQCPIRIKDGDLLLCQSVDIHEFRRNWRDYQNEIIMVVPNACNSLHIDFSLAKQFVRMEHEWFVVMRMFNPPQEIELAIDEIEKIAIIKKVIQ